GRTDGELLALFAANGNQAALEEIIRRHAPMVRTVCRRAARRLRDCEDMMQSVFVTLARRAPDLLGYVSLAVSFRQT
ncbi:MAG TPA: sigma factor, partial [Rhodopila sp.]|nr:sigma factor [Rhodopila sp.]